MLRGYAAAELSVMMEGCDQPEIPGNIVYDYEVCVRWSYNANQAPVELTDHHKKCRHNLFTIQSIAEINKITHHSMHEIMHN